MSGEKGTLAHEDFNEFPLTFVEYQDAAKQTDIYGHAISVYVGRLNLPDKAQGEELKALLRKCYIILGLVGEAGELANKMKKIIRDDNGEVSEEKNKEIRKEFGDTLWYEVMGIREFGGDSDTIAKQNLAKLYRRQVEDKLGGEGDNR